MAKVPEYDVIVIGGGMSGLSTAFRIAEQKKTVLVLEAGEKFGGRTRSVEFQDPNKSGKHLSVSYGGTWSMIDDVLTLGLADVVESRLFKPHASTEFTTVAEFILMATHPYLLFKLWLIGARLYEDNPYDYWRHPHAREYDKINLEQWLKDNQLWIDRLRDNPIFTWYNSKTTVHDWFLLLENQPIKLDKISTLWAAIMVYLRLSHWTKGGLIPPRILRWPAGTQTFVTALEKKVESFSGCKCISNSSVTMIDQSNGKYVTVHVGDKKYTASYVSVSTGITSSTLMKYNPALPEGVKILTTGLATWDDPAINLIYVFKKSSGWQDGFSYLPKASAAPPIESGQVWGAVMELSEKALVPGYEDSRSYGVIRILVDKQRTKNMKEPEIVSKGLEYLINTVFDHITVSGMRSVVKNYKKTCVINKVMDWKDTESIPGVTYYWKPGFLTEKAIISNKITLGGVSGARKLDVNDVIVNGDYLKAIFGRVHFGGSERSIRGLHWIEGAVRRGAEVAGEILVAMGDTPVKDIEKYMLLLEEQGTDAAGHYSSNFLDWKRKTEVKVNRAKLLKELGVKGDLEDEAVTPVPSARNNSVAAGGTSSAAVAVASGVHPADIPLPNEEDKKEELWRQLKGDEDMSYGQFCHYARRAFAKREQRIKHEQEMCRNKDCAKYVPFRGHPPTLELLKEGVPSSPPSCRLLRSNGNNKGANNNVKTSNNTNNNNNNNSNNSNSSPKDLQKASKDKKSKDKKKSEI